MAGGGGGGGGDIKKSIRNPVPPLFLPPPPLSLSLSLFLSDLSLRLGVISTEVATSERGHELEVK